MEAVGVAASIIQLITAALQSAKAIQTVLSGIEDGPAHVNELSTKLGDLRGILPQLQSLQSTSGNAFDELMRSTQRCATDLQVFEIKF